MTEESRKAFAEQLEDLIDEHVDSGGDRNDVIAVLMEKAVALKDEQGADAEKGADAA